MEGLTAAGQSGESFQCLLCAVCVGLQQFCNMHCSRSILQHMISLDTQIQRIVLCTVTMNGNIFINKMTELFQHGGIDCRKKRIFTVQQEFTMPLCPVKDVQLLMKDIFLCF